MSTGKNAKEFFVGEWRVAPALDEIARGSETVKLEPRVMRLLTLLAARPGEVVTIDEVLESVWAGVVVTQSSVYNSVASLRKLLGDDGEEARYIATVPRRGYRLIAAVTERSRLRDSAATEIAEGWPHGVAPEFDGLKVLRLIGEGSAGQVFVAQEPSLERLVAVKLLKPTLLDNATARARFQREALAAARIKHPNVATIHRVGELSNGTPYIAYEYVEGRNLADALRHDGAYTIAKALHILTSLADALAAADEKRIIHRDVKPGNLLLENKSDRIVLTDFGIAGLQQSGRAVDRLTHANESLGDPRYASPEQIRGEALTSATDIYSLGVLGYELLVTQSPFAANAIHELAQSHVSAEPIDLMLLRPDVPDSLCRLLRRCLEKKAGERPTAADLSQQLQKIDSTAAKPASHTYAQHPSRNTTPPRWRVWIVGAALLAAVLVLAKFYVLNGRP